MANQLNYQNYVIRRKFFILFGAKFHIFNPNGEVVIFSKLKAFRLREDVRLYTGEDMTQELIHIQARRIIDISSFYDVFDSQSGEKIGCLRRKGLKSIFRDEWDILDINDQIIGLIKEDHGFLAFLRRFLSNLIPQSYNVYLGNTLVGVFSQNFNPFLLKMNLDFSPDQNGYLDKRLGIAAGIMLCAIDGRQN